MRRAMGFKLPGEAQVRRASVGVRHASLVRRVPVRLNCPG